MKASITLAEPGKRKTPLPSRVMAAAFWLLVWQGAYWAVGKDLILVSPLTCLERLLALMVRPDFWGIVAGSLGRILAGFFLGLVLGILIAAATARWQFLYPLFSLPMNIIRATPVASFAILALLFLSGPGFSIFIAFLMVLPLVWSNVHEGLTHLDPQLLEMARVFRLPRSAVLKQIIFPSTLPYLLSAVRVGLGFCWKAGVAGEVIAIPANAIGTQLYNAKVYLETGDLFAWTAVIILLSMALERCAVWLLDRGAKRLHLQKEGKGC